MGEDIVIHIHEDDAGMRSLAPLAAQPEIATDVQEAAAAGERNRCPSGVGWTDIHVIAPPSVTYADLGLRLADAVTAVPSSMPRVRRFHATATSGFGSHERDPYGSYEEDAWCFGFGAHCFIKFGAAGELVANIWFECAACSDAERHALRDAIAGVDRIVPSVIADYWLDVTGPAASEAFLDRYFRLLAGESD